MHLKWLKDSSFFLKTNETIKPIFYLNPFQKYQINQTLPFSPLRVILPTPHNPAPETLLTFIHTLLALVIILYPVLIIQKEHPQPFFTYIKIPTHPSGVSKTTIASTAPVMTHGLKLTFMPQAYPVNFHREVSLTLLYFLSHFSQKNHWPSSAILLQFFLDNSIQKSNTFWNKLL